MATLEIAIAAFGFALAISIVRSDFPVIGKRTNFKPLNCKFCMAFWATAGYTYWLNADIKSIVVYSFFAAAFTYVIDNLLTKSKKGPFG